MKSVYLLAITFLTLTTAFAQRNFAPGTVTYLDGKTETVLIRHKTDKHNHTSVRVRIPATGNDTLYTPGQIQSYATSGGKIYLSSQIKKYPLSTDSLAAIQMPVFVQQLVKGQLSLFFWRGRQADRFFIQSQGEETQELIRKTKTTIKEQDYITKGNYQAILSSLTSNCPADAYTLAHLSASRPALIRVVKEYNQCPQVDNLTYVYKPLRGAIYLGVKGSLYMHTLIVNGYINGYFARQESRRFQQVTPGFGLFSEFQLTDLDKKLSLQAEVLYTKLQFDNVSGLPLTTRLVQIPLSVKYDILSSALTPYLYGGAFVQLNRSTYESDSYVWADAFNARVDTRLMGGAGIKWKQAGRVFALDYRMHHSFLGSDTQFMDTELRAGILSFSCAWKVR